MTTPTTRAADGARGSTDQRPNRRRGAAPPTPSRLPAPARDRRPALAALAVLLIVGGALASGLIALRIGNRADYLVVRSEVAPGQRIEAGDLGVARIAGTGARAIPAAQRERVVGEYAVTRLFPGTLLTSAMVTAGRPLPTGSAEVGLVLAPGQVPAGGLNAGDVVRVFRVASGDGFAADAGETVAPAVLVTQVGNGVTTATDDRTGVPRGTDTVIVTVLVSAGDAQRLVNLANGKAVGVARLAPGTKPAVDLTGSGG